MKEFKFEVTCRCTDESYEDFVNLLNMDYTINDFARDINGEIEDLLYNNDDTLSSITSKLIWIKEDLPGDEEFE